MLFVMANLKNLFKRGAFYVDHSTKIQPADQTGARRRPFGSLAQVSNAIKKGETVKVVIVRKNGKREPPIKFTCEV